MFYINRDASNLAGVTSRQCLGWSDKGLIVPAIEAAGAGTKRHYDYTNLIELGVAKGLFDLGQGIQSVKKILADLRRTNILGRWAEDPTKFFKSEWQRLGKEYREPPTDYPRDSERWRWLVSHFHKFFLEEPLKFERSAGILYYFVGSRIKLNHFIFPEIYDIDTVESFTVVEILLGRLALFEAAIILNVGRIKDRIDAKINAYTNSLK